MCCHSSNIVFCLLLSLSVGSACDQECSQQALHIDESSLGGPSLQLLQKKVGVEDASLKLQVPGSPQGKGNDVNLCPAAELGSPSLCKQGNDIWTKSQLVSALPEFAEVYKKRPTDLVYNASPNHAFALWFTVRQLKPKYIIESGVHKGGSTWMMRQAAGPETKIIALDPVPESNLVYKDKDNTQYFLGDRFRDLSAMEWDSLISDEDRDKTLVMLDDHVSVAERVPQLSKLGFVHLWFGPNYRHGEPGQDVYSFNIMCSTLAENMSASNAEMVLFQNTDGQVQLPLQQHKKNQDTLFSQLDVYYEFPAIWNGACTDPDELVGQEQLAALGLPVPSEAQYYYYTSHPPYVKLRSQRQPKSTNLVQEAMAPKSCPAEFLVLPYHCTMGQNFATQDQVRSVVPDFAKLMARAPPEVQSMNMNEAFALYYTVRTLQPRYIIESGASMGLRTWIMRQTALANTAIFVLDPRSQDQLKLVDRSGSTQYIMEWDFQDFRGLKWSRHIPDSEHDHTLVVFADHHDASGRLRDLQNLGFSNAWFASNPTYDEKQDAYSMNIMCSLMAESQSHGTVKRTHLHQSNQMQLTEHKTNQEYISKNMDVYFEIPPLWDQECGFTGQLYPNLSEINKMGIPHHTDGQFHHGHFPLIRMKSRA